MLAQHAAKDRSEGTWRDETLRYLEVLLGHFVEVCEFLVGIGNRARRMARCIANRLLGWWLFDDTVDVLEYQGSASDLLELPSYVLIRPVAIFVWNKSVRRKDD